MPGIRTRTGSRRGRSVVNRSVTEAHLRLNRSPIAVQALDRMGAGVIITDERGRIVQTNAAAAGILRAGEGLVAQDGRLMARRGFETAKLGQLIARATASPGEEGLGRLLVGRFGSTTGYVLTVASLRRNPGRGDHRFAMIIVVDPQRHMLTAPDLAELFGLSPAEARLAAALMQGDTLLQIADFLGIRVTTVRTELASILRKVGVKRQSELVRILSTAAIGAVSPSP